VHVVRRPVARVATAGFLAALALAGCSSPQGPSVTATPSGRASASASPTGQPDPGGAGDPAARAAALVKELDDAELVGQVLMPSVNMSDPGAADVVRSFRLGGVILMGNVQDTGAGGTAGQVRAYTDKLREAAGDTARFVVGTDQEYGWVTRIKSGVVQLPSAMAFGAARRPELTEAAWRGAGAELAAAGIDIDFAPDADVIGSAGNFIIGSRSYGSDPAGVSTQVAAAVKGLQSAGVAASIKHFPGHGHTTVDSHTGLPVLRQSMSQLQAQDLPPFKAGIDAGSWVVMAGHLDVRAVDPGVPATFSRKVLVDLLRTRMGFQGVVVSDALNMAPARRWAAGEAAVRALIAGNDLLLMPPSLTEARSGLLNALNKGRLPRARLIEAVTRVLTLKFRLDAADRPDVSTVDNAENRDAARAVAAAAVTVMRGSCSGALVRAPIRVTSSAGRTRQVAWLTEALRANGVTVVSSGGQRVHLVGYGDGTDDLVSGAAATVAMDTPYLLRSASSPVRVATYSSTQVAMEALAAVIAGKATAPGRSPVAVSGLPRSACNT
jgi:beta-N-acetylhexosaminidase